MFVHLHSYLVLLSLLVGVSRGQETCSGFCPGPPSETLDSSPATTSVSRAETCPASDCDGTGVLEHHLGDTHSGVSLGCIAPDRSTRQNAFMRCFEADDCGDERRVEAVRFGVKSLTVDNYVVQVRLKKGPLVDCSTVSGVRELYDSTAVVTVSTNPLLQRNSYFEVEVSIPEGIILAPNESLLVEVDAPSLVSRGGKFFVADSDDVDQCSPSYLQSNDCQGSKLPEDVALARPSEDYDGKPDVSYVISVFTSSNAPSPAPTAPPSSPPVPSPPPTDSPTNSPVEPPTEPPASDIGSCFVSLVAIIYCIIGLFFPAFRP